MQSHCKALLVGKLRWAVGAALDASHRQNWTDCVDRRNRCAGDGRAKDEGGARLWFPARSGTPLVVCQITCFCRIAFMRVSREVKVRALCCVSWYRTSGGSTTARAMAFA